MIRRHSISWFLATACILALAASCVYPFAPEAGSEDGSGALVIEGDILLGDYTTVTLSYSSAVSTPKVSDDPPRGAVWVEDDAGRTYRGVPVSGAPGTYRVDTREAAAGPQYRLCVQNMDTNKEYMSAWADACRAPVIDSLSYIMDYDRERMNIAISMHSQAGSFFKWRYVEDWEYHSVYEARLLYTPPSLDRWGHPVTAGNLGEMPSGLNTHVCWGHKASSEILIFTTEKQTDDRFVDLEFHSIARNDDRISVIYHIDVVLEPISRDAYLYWNNMKTISEYGGNLFAPTPSEMVGNIRCAQDPDELVLGFINVAETARKDLYIRQSVTRFYRNNIVYEDPEHVGEMQWYSFYQQGYLPVDYYRPGDLSETLWAVDRCVDCRMKGGTNVKPDFWLNNGQ